MRAEGIIRARCAPAVGRSFGRSVFLVLSTSEVLPTTMLAMSAVSQPARPDTIIGPVSGKVPLKSTVFAVGSRGLSGGGVRKKPTAPVQCRWGSRFFPRQSRDRAERAVHALSSATQRFVDSPAPPDFMVQGYERGAPGERVAMMWPESAHLTSNPLSLRRPVIFVGASGIPRSASVAK